MAKYIVRDYFYDPPEDKLFKNKNEVIEYLLERIGDVQLVIE